MYLGQMTCEVDLADRYKLGGFNSVEVKKSIHQIVQTAKLVLPASVVMRNNDKIEQIKLADKIKEGDKISISFGYNGDNKKEFTGYIKTIDRKIPVEIECEDSIFLFRKTTVKKIFNNVSIKSVLQNLCDSVNQAHGVRIKVFENIPDIIVKNFKANDKTALWALQQLIDWYPMLSIRLVEKDGIEYLYCGLLYATNDISARVKYALNGNQNNTVSVDELKYNTETVTTKVVWEITKDDGTVEKKQYGDSNAELVINKKVSGKVDGVILKQMSEYEITQKNYNGFKGSFTTFLFPYCEPGIIAQIDDPQFGRTGNYFIGTVITTFSTSSGGRRKAEIDFKLR